MTKDAALRLVQDPPRKRAKPKRLRLTLHAVKTQCRPPGPDDKAKQVIYWDTEVRGFGIVVRRPKKGGAVNASFIVVRVVGPKETWKVTIGKFGAWTVEAARKRARELRVQMDQGINPNDEKRARTARALTVGEVLATHLEDMRRKGRSERSLGDFKHGMKKYLAGWSSKPLLDVDGPACRDLHDRLTKNHGPYVANRVVRYLRAAWNTASRVYPDVPERNPTRAVVFHEERVRDDPVPWDELPGWWKQVQAMRNPVLRDLQVFYLLTGLRRNDGKSVRWEDVDLEAGTIHRPNPKGGKKRAFTVPLAGYVLDMLKRRREENTERLGDDGGWVFPSRKRDGTLTCVWNAREQRFDEDGKKVPDRMPSPHRLRRTFATAGYECFLRELDLKILMNHSVPKGNVTHRYIHPSEDHLRDCVEKVCSFLLAKAGVEVPEEKDADYPLAASDPASRSRVPIADP